MGAEKGEHMHTGRGTTHIGACRDGQHEEKQLLHAGLTTLVMGSQVQQTGMAHVCLSNKSAHPALIPPKFKAKRNKRKQKNDNKRLAVK